MVGPELYLACLDVIGVELLVDTAACLVGGPLASNVAFFMLNSDNGGSYLEWDAVFPSEFASLHPTFKIYATQYASAADTTKYIDITSQLNIVLQDQKSGHYKAYLPVPPQSRKYRLMVSTNQGLAFHDARQSKY